MNPLIIGPIVDLAGKVFDKILPDKEQASRAKSEFIQRAADLEQHDIDSFRDFVVKYEGEGDKIHPVIQILRGSVRPLLTYFLVGCFAYGFINPDAVKEETMKMLFNLNLLTAGFWFGERALKNLGLKITK